MKDLMALIIILGLITFGMMVTRQHYYEREAEANSDWRERTYGQRAGRRAPAPRPRAGVTLPEPSATPSPSLSPH